MTMANCVKKTAQEELLQEAEAALHWLYVRRAHMPPEQLDPREASHRNALQEAIRKWREG